MSRPGDWNCRSCSHLNFQRRDSCQRCGDSRPDGGRGGGDYGGRFGGGGGSFGGGGGFSGPDVRPGDWYCSVGNCGAHNFASRSSCFKCGAFKEESGGGAGGYDGDGMGRSRGRNYLNGILVFGFSTIVSAQTTQLLLCLTNCLRLNFRPATHRRRSLIPPDSCRKPPTPSPVTSTPL